MLLARVQALSPPDATSWPAHLWRLERQGDHWSVHATGWHALDRRTRLARLNTILANAASWPGLKRLTWEVSGVVLEHAAIVESDRLWRATGDVPVLDFIALDFGARDGLGRKGVVTRGLAIVAGVEIEALWTEDNLNRQSILVARLAAHVAVEGSSAAGEVKDQNGDIRSFSRRDLGNFTANPVISLGLPDTD